MYHSPEDIADIVSLVIVAVCAVATFALCITGTKVKARGDLARKAVPSYHSTTWLYFMYVSQDSHAPWCPSLGMSTADPGRLFPPLLGVSPDSSANVLRLS